MVVGNNDGHFNKKNLMFCFSFSSSCKLTHSLIMNCL